MLDVGVPNHLRRLFVIGHVVLDVRSVVAALAEGQEDSQQILIGEDPREGGAGEPRRPPFDS